MTRATLHLDATQRTRPGNGSGIASVDIHAWLLTLALAILLRDDLNGWLHPQVTQTVMPGHSVITDPDRQPYGCVSGSVDPGLLLAQPP